MRSKESSCLKEVFGDIIDLTFARARNEKQLVEELLTRVLGECIEVELLAADSQFES